MSFTAGIPITNGPFSNPADTGGSGPDDGSFDEGYDAGYDDGHEDGLAEGGVDPLNDWTLVTGWGGLYDPNSRLASSSTTGGLLTFTMAGDISAYAGYQTTAPRYSVKFDSIPGMSGFNPILEDLEIYCEIPMLPTATSAPQYGVFLALANGNTPASDNAVAAGVRAASAGAVTSQGMGTTTVGGGTGSFAHPIGGIRYTLTFVHAANAINYIALMGQKGNSGYTSSFGAVNLVASAQFGPDISTWYLQAGAWHANTTTGTPTMQQRVHIRRIARKDQFPHVDPATKKTSGTLRVIALGDSTMRGYTTSQTPPDGQAGEAIAAGISFWDQGSSTATWPATSNNGPNPGYLEAFARTALLNGFTAVEIHRWSANGREITTMMTSEWASARAEIANASTLPSDIDLVLISIGTNDASNTTEVTAFETNLPTYVDMIERWYYNARVIFFEPATTSATVALIDDINAALASVTAAKNTRGLVPGNGHATIADNLHLTAATYETDGIAAFGIYQSLS